LRLPGSEETETVLTTCVVGIKRWIVLVCVAVLALLGSCTVPSTGSLPDNRNARETRESGSVAAEPRNTAAGSVARSVKADFLKPAQEIRNPSVAIQKERRRLYVFQQDTLVREYPIGLGFGPTGDKERDNDGRTPEGDFYICGKKEGEGAGKVLIISYPSRKHVERAQFQGFLDPLQAKGIIGSLEKRAQPPADTPLGGNVCIQGGGAHEDWTNGSVALYDSDMAELYTVAQLGTPIYIRP
jgi:hypothetical protein